MYLEANTSLVPPGLEYFEKHHQRHGGMRYGYRRRLHGNAGRFRKRVGRDCSGEEGRHGGHSNSAASPFR